MKRVKWIVWAVLALAVVCAVPETAQARYGAGGPLRRGACGLLGRLARPFARLRGCG